MPSFLIIHSGLHDGELSAYRQPPTLDIAGLRAPLDWGDITLHVPAGDLPVTVYVTRTNGQVEGATITVRAPAGTGTRLTFVPPLQPGGRSLLRIDGQWSADATMHYYAARDARALQQPTQPMPWAGREQSPPSLHPQPPQQAQAHVQAPHLDEVQPEQVDEVPPQHGDDAQPQHDPHTGGVRVISPSLGHVESPSPPIGPTPGSTGAVPLHTSSSFGHEQGSRVDPVQSSSSAPSSRQAAQPSRAPSFGQRADRAERPAPSDGPAPADGAARSEHSGRSERDIYGREHTLDDHLPASIPTPAAFHQLEQEAAESQRRVHDAWQAQQSQHARQAPPLGDGAPRPIGLAANASQPQPNWYPDPFRRADARWFDGRQWTASVMRGGVRGTDQPG
ncbi:DUF2510 domain-containing protein [Agrococcus sp. ProA11]|uniref:DUF2510 domain-containing protein n=1 Tax=Agrococcus chionoecetis TaxID=3153752 RepID=UPI0032607EBB